MDQILNFFSTLILATAGIIVVLLWVVIFIAIGVEVYDMFTGKHQDDEDDFGGEG